MAGQCLYVAWKHGDDWSVFVSSWNPPKNCPWFHRYPVSIQTLWRIILKFVETQNKFKISAKKHNLSRCTVEVGFHHFSHRNVNIQALGWGFFFQIEIYIWSRMVLQGGEGEKEGLERLGGSEDQYCFQYENNNIFFSTNCTYWNCDIIILLSGTQLPRCARYLSNPLQRLLYKGWYASLILRNTTDIATL